MHDRSSRYTHHHPVGVLQRIQLIEVDWKASAHQKWHPSTPYYQHHTRKPFHPCHASQLREAGQLGGCVTPMACYALAGCINHLIQRAWSCSMHIRSAVRQVTSLRRRAHSFKKPAVKTACHVQDTYEHTLSSKHLPHAPGTKTISGMRQCAGPPRAALLRVRAPLPSPSLLPRRSRHGHCLCRRRLRPRRRS